MVQFALVLGAIVVMSLAASWLGYVRPWPTVRERTEDACKPPIPGTSLLLGSNTRLARAAIYAAHSSSESEEFSQRALSMLVDAHGPGVRDLANLQPTAMPITSYRGTTRTGAHAYRVVITRTPNDDALESMPLSTRKPIRIACTTIDYGPEPSTTAICSASSFDLGYPARFVMSLSWTEGEDIDLPPDLLLNRVKELRDMLLKTHSHRCGYSLAG